MGDNSELFRIEAGLLKELAQLDDDIDKYKATQAQVGGGPLSKYYNVYIGLVDLQTLCLSSLSVLILPVCVFISVWCD